MPGYPGNDLGISEDGAFRLAFLHSPTARGLRGVDLVISDANQGLKDAIATVIAAPHGKVSNPLHDQPADWVPKRAQPRVTTMVRAIYPPVGPKRLIAGCTGWWSNPGSCSPRWRPCWSTQALTS